MSCFEETTGIVKFNLPTLLIIGGISDNFDSLVKYIKLLFMHSPAVFVKPCIEPRGGRNGNYLNSKMTSKIDLVLLWAAKFAINTPISKASKLVVYPVSSKNIIAGEIVLVAPPKRATDPITPYNPSCCMSFIPNCSPI